MPERTMRLNAVISRTNRVVLNVCEMLQGDEKSLCVYCCVIWFLWRVTKVIKANIVSTFWPRNEYIFFFFVSFGSVKIYTYIRVKSGSNVSISITSHIIALSNYLYRLFCIPFHWNFLFFSICFEIFLMHKFCGSIRWIRP